MLRTGLLAVKRGMTGVFTDKGRRWPVTVLQLDRVQVVKVKTRKADGYDAVQVGCGLRHAKATPRPLLGHFAQAHVAPKRKLAEFRVRDAAGLLPPGLELLADHFRPGALVDVQAVAKGKGFAGVMKRWGFKGLRATHGTSLAHRSGGSYGQSQDPGRVLPGKKMPGRMGGKKVTTQNVPVVAVDRELGVILVKGPVPGPNRGYVRISDAIKGPQSAPTPVS